MLDFVLRLTATLGHAALVFALAPLLMGAVTKFRAWTLGRRGPPFLQPYRTLYKLLRKTALVPETATDLFPAWPFASFLAIATAIILAQTVIATPIIAESTALQPAAVWDEFDWDDGSLWQ